MHKFINRIFRYFKKRGKTKRAKADLKDINSLINEDLLELFKTLDVYRSVSPIADSVNFFKHSLNQLNFIEKQIMKHIPYNLNEISILDYGCGGGGIGIVCSKVLKADTNLTYSGMDITEKRVSLLNEFASSEKVSFYKLDDGGLIDYIGVRDGLISEKSESSLQVDASELPATKNAANVQFSSSVFTHMTPKQITQRLRQFRERGVQLSINSFFIITDTKLSYLKSNLMANGRRNFEIYDAFDGYQAYVEDVKNPLFTIGFSYESIIKMYEDSGWKIISVEEGDWASVYSTNRPPLNYQDWIIAIPR